MRRRKAVSGLGAAMIAFVVVFTLALAAIMVGGVFDKEISNVFSDLGINGTDWDTLRTTAASYAQTGLRINMVGIILTAVILLLGIIVGFAKKAGYI